SEVRFLFQLALQGVHATLLDATRRTVAWLRLQLVEIGHEIRRVTRPAVRVRRHGTASIAVSTAASHGGGVLLLPLGGDRIVGVTWSRGALADQGLVVTKRPTESDIEFTHPYGVEAYADGPQGREVWPIAAFETQADAEHCMQTISSAMAGGRRTGGWLLGAASAAVVVLLVASLIRPAATAADASEKTTPEQATPVGDVLRDAFGGSTATPDAVESAPVTAPASAGESLAEQIYAQAMAASQQSAYEAGPPQSPIENPQAGDFGLGAAGKEGCDPALKFTVASQP
ncbi:MAG: hypothetical protein WKF61_05735, partial [Luteimonas sp.]